MKAFILMLAALSPAALLTAPAAAADLQAGMAKAQAVCQTCHGLDGRATQAGTPNLAGQQEDYLVIQLEAYRSGQRQHPQMSIIAGMLSDADIENVARWYSSIRVTLELPE